MVLNNRDSLVVPFFLENELINSGVQYFAKDEWKAHVLEDSRIVAAQNPQSVEDFGSFIIALIY
ncbi:hypothetical protein CDV26_02565 [Francisella halioticida]|uniref:Uncharacterized protein n=1 Tax=Francisella halioticida TaxID=549298 RepID=A0ABM6LY41_9GAMM|nr:hypothetical protein CDV26_02565 [Francisella halioticida]